MATLAANQMKELTSAERVLRVLRREEPDRIPHFEWIIDRRVRDAICPGSTMEEFTVRMGLDAILTAPDYQAILKAFEPAVRALEERPRLDIVTSGSF